MKLTNESFQIAVKWGGLVLMLSTVGNVYFLLRHREVYRDASRIEQEIVQQGATLAVKQQALEGVIRDFAARANTDAKITEILQHHLVQRPATPAAASATKK